MSKSTPIPSRSKAPPPKKVSFNKENEGVVVPHRVISAEPGLVAGEARIHMIMDLQSAPAPRRKFVADAFSILVRDHNYHLVFIQRRIDGKKFRAIVDVQIPADAASSLANSFQYAEVPPTIANSIEVLEEPPEQTITLAASFARSAAAGSNCCIDFYYTSPFAVRVVQQIQELHAEPEVRIVLSDFVYHGFVSALREILKLPSLTQDNSAKLVF